MIFLSVLSTEQSFLTPEETIRCVLIAAHMKQCWWYESRFSDITPRGSDGLVFAGFQVVHGNVSQNTLTSQPTTTDALALLGHGGSGTGGGLDGEQSVVSNAANRRQQDITRDSADGNRQTQKDRVRMDEVNCVHSEDHQDPN